jgi:ABC-2 type transport system permease protein
LTSPAIVSAPERPHPASFFLRRVWAVALRHLFLYRGSWPRVVETLFWPMINMLMLGFASLFLLQRFSSATIIANVFLAGVLLNETMLRTSMGMMVMFLEEIWSRNLGHFCRDGAVQIFAV